MFGARSERKTGDDRPGSWTIDGQELEKDIDLIVITHEHPDHMHISSLKKVLINNPNAIIITNAGVGKILDDVGIKYKVLKDKIETEISNVILEAHDCKHEEIYEEIGQVQNIGFFIGKRLFYPGDSFYNPQKPVEILALPVAGPWTRIKDAIKYALEINPKVCFPVHDGMIDPSFGTAHRVPALVLPKFGIEFKNFENIKEEEF